MMALAPGLGKSTGFPLEETAPIHFVCAGTASSHSSSSRESTVLEALYQLPACEGVRTVIVAGNVER